ncbi:MAG: c-type cytochrome [Pseudomonadota bacterium]
MRTLTVLSAAVALAAGAHAQDAAAGDPAKGERVFKQCVACHTFDPNARRQGPHLLNLWGRSAGSAEGVRYSPAMAASGIIWDDETLGPYLLDPRGTVPGTSMMIGLRNEGDLADLLAYMRRESSGAE